MISLTARAGVGAACLVALVGCSSRSSATPPTSTTSVVPTTTTIDPAAATGLVHGFNHILGTANGALFAFGDRVKAGVDTSGASLPPDFVASGATLATADLAAAGALTGTTWPPAVQPQIDEVVADLRTFAADLQLLSGLAPTLLHDWQNQFDRDGAALNGAEDAVRAALGSAPAPPPMNPPG